jgi:hypothetical protein
VGSVDRLRSGPDQIDVFPTAGISAAAIGVLVAPLTAAEGARHACRARALIVPQSPRTLQGGVRFAFTDRIALLLARSLISAGFPRRGRCSEQHRRP